MLFFKGLSVSPEEIMKNHDVGKGSKVQQFVDNECIKHMDKYTPKDTGDLIRSATNNTSIGSGQIVQHTPYARRWYYTPANFSEGPRRGNKWFERMKESHKSDILSGAAKIIGAKHE